MVKVKMVMKLSLKLRPTNDLADFLPRTIHAYLILNLHLNVHLHLNLNLHLHLASTTPISRKPESATILIYPHFWFSIYPAWRSNWLCVGRSRATAAGSPH